VSQIFFVALFFIIFFQIDAQMKKKIYLCTHFAIEIGHPFKKTRQNGCLIMARAEKRSISESNNKQFNKVKIWEK